MAKLPKQEIDVRFLLKDGKISIFALKYGKETINLRRTDLVGEYEVKLEPFDHAEEYLVLPLETLNAICEAWKQAN